MKNIITVLFLAFAMPSFAQFTIDSRVTTTNHFQTHILTTRRGDIFVGRTLDIDSGQVTFKLEKGNSFRLNFDEIDSLALANRLGRLAYQRSDFGERTSLMPTAFSLPRGAWEYHNEMLLHNTVNYGVRDNFTVGLGFFAFPYYYYYNVHMKLSQPLGEYVHFALGTVLGNGTINDQYIDGGKYLSRYVVPFGSLTLGSRQNFISVSMGKGYYYEDDSADEPEWLYTVNAAVRPTKRLRLYTEIGNTIEGYSERYYNAGLGFIGKKSIFNMGVLFGEDVYSVVPILSYSRRFR